MYLLKKEPHLQPLQTGDWAQPLVRLSLFDFRFTIMDVLISECLFVSVRQAHGNPDHSLSEGLRVLIDSRVSLLVTHQKRENMELG